MSEKKKKKKTPAELLARAFAMAKAKTPAEP